MTTVSVGATILFAITDRAAFIEHARRVARSRGDASAIHDIEDAVRSLVFWPNEPSGPGYELMDERTDRVES